MTDPMTSFRRRSFLGTGWLRRSLPAVPAGAQAQTYPSKPVRLVLPYAPGGIIDYVGRMLAQKLSDTIGQPVVAENRPGAGGIRGHRYGRARRRPTATPS